MTHERGVFVDHSTVHLWALKIFLFLALGLSQMKASEGTCWRLSETYVVVAVQWKTCIARSSKSVVR